MNIYMYNSELIGCSPFPSFQTQNESVTLDKFQAHHWLVKQDLGRCQIRLAVASSASHSSGPQIPCRTWPRTCAAMLGREAIKKVTWIGLLTMRYWSKIPILSFLRGVLTRPKERKGGEL